MKQLYYSYTIDAPIALVWATITTVEGIKSYLSQDCHVVPEVGGPYEIYFDTTMPEGQRGSEGMKVLCMEEERRFGHTWNNPPSVLYR